MNQSLHNIFDITHKNTRTILGLMSGTSADALDISLSKISGSGLQTQYQLLYFASVPFDREIKKKLQDRLFDETLSVGEMLTLQEKLQEVWAAIINRQIATWEFDFRKIDLVASHGQTLFHRPAHSGSHAASLQIIDGDYLAFKLNIPVISDFRQKHIAAGLQGAPISPLAEQLLFSTHKNPMVFLNLGGIANITLIDKSNHPSLPFSTDIGPANTLIDAAIRHFYTTKLFDGEGEIAASGTCNRSLLTELKKHPFFHQKSPKSTGPESFQLEWVLNVIEQKQFEAPREDVISTLTHLTSWSVAREIQSATKNKPLTIYVSGGGWHNQTLIKLLKEELSEYQICSTDNLGIPPDAKEAILFSVLANETICGQGWHLPNGQFFTLGKLSFPPSKNETE